MWNEFNVIFLSFSMLKLFVRIYGSEQGRLPVWFTKRESITISLQAPHIVLDHQSKILRSATLWNSIFSPSGWNGRCCIQPELRCWNENGLYVLEWKCHTAPKHEVGSHINFFNTIPILELFPKKQLIFLSAFLGKL